MDKLSGRLISLDVFRGITIAGMILVNNPGTWSKVYPPLLHAPWNGWTPTDFIFPFFLFIVGVAMSLSFSKRIERGDSKSQLYAKIVRRTLIIFAIGFFLNLFPFFNFKEVRIPGVLQRIALCYFFASVIMVEFNKKWQIGWVVFLLGIYWILVKLVPVPGYGAGVLEPKGSLCWYIDSNLLAGHTWNGAPAPGFDPEGILSTLPAIVTVLFGVFAGDWIRSPREQYEKVSGLFVFGILGLVIAEVLKGWLPINKNLWTSTYSIFMAGMALIFLAMCYWFIDIKGYKKWGKPFIVFGSNAILVFSLSSLIAKITFTVKWTQPNGKEISLKSFLYNNLFTSWTGNNEFSSLLYPIALLLFWLGIMWILYRKNIFVKI
jgi:predicted acyltransferase